MDNATQCSPQEGKALLQHNQPTLDVELKQKQERIELQLADIKRLRRLLAENPTLSEFQNLLLRCRNM